MEKATNAKHIRAGCVEVTVWENGKGEKVYKSVTLQKNYKDRDGNWQRTASLKANDIPKAIVALEKAYETIILSRASPKGE